MIAAAALLRVEKRRRRRHNNARWLHGRCWSNSRARSRTRRRRSGRCIVERDALLRHVRDQADRHRASHHRVRSVVVVLRHLIGAGNGGSWDGGRLRALLHLLRMQRRMLPRRALRRVVNVDATPRDTHNENGFQSEIVHSHASDAAAIMLLLPLATDCVTCDH